MECAGEGASNALGFRLDGGWLRRARLNFFPFFPKCKMNGIVAIHISVGLIHLEPVDEQLVILDLGFAINWDKATSTYIKVVDKNSLVGYRNSTGWAKNQKVFFAIEFSKSIENYD